MSSESDSFADSDIAIIGRAGRFAGSPDVDTLWRNFRDGVECVSHYSDEELLEAGVDPALLKNPKYVRAGGFLPDVAQFDAGFFGFGPKDAAILDPQHRHFMECAWHAFEDAAQIPSGFDGSIGVFAGCGMNSYFMFNLLTNPDIIESTGLFLLRHTGNDRDFLPTTLSYKLNLTGPSVAVQTACSTSLVAIHMGCQSLLSGESDMVLAGGVTIEVPHRHGYIYREGEPLTPDGRTCSFDERGTGIVLTSGIGVVVLRRLADAIEDGDPIHAVIKGSAVNNDGSQKVSYLAPSVDGQAAVIAEALAVADVSADDVSYVETHGTGTAVGDPIEVAALTQAFRHSSERNQYCGIGSCKPNLGHTDNAAGIASVLKVIEAMKHRQLPPSINFNRPNPAIDFENSPFYVNDTLKDWESATPRLAGVSSLGVGGTNAHIVLQEAPERPTSDPAKGLQILPYSAKSKKALEGNAEALAAYFESSPEQNFADAAHTLQVGRESFEHRAVLVCRDAAEASSALREADPQRVFTAKTKGGKPTIVFMFPGTGAQYPNMGFDLYQNEPVYRAAMDECFEAGRRHADFDLKASMYVGENVSEEHAEQLSMPSRSLACTFATEYALAKLWISWGIEPVAMTGHSMGEYTAACLAGVMSVEDALALVWLRGNLAESLEIKGRMISVPLSEAELLEIMWDDLDLAVINGPSLCVVSGTVERIEEFDLFLRERDVEGRQIRVKAAAHTRLLDPILEQFRARVETIEFHEPQIPYISNRSGDWITAEDATDPDHWVRHLREPVRFAEGLSTLMKGHDRIAIEIGPGQSMCSISRQQSDKARAAIPTLPQANDATPDDQFTRTSFGRVWAAGGQVDWSALRGEERRLRVSLPTYAFDRQHYWIEAGKQAHSAAETTRELERIENLDQWFWRPVWRTAPDTPGDAADYKPNWLVFADTSGIATRLIDQLEKYGHAVTVVREGDAFYRLGDREYALSPEAGSEGYAALLRALSEADQLPDRIAHLWLLTTDESARAGSNFFHRNEERGFYSMLFLAQALGAEDVTHDIHIGVVSNGMQQVADEGLPYPEKSLVLGPVGVIAQEFPHVTCQTIDVQLPEDSDRDAREEALARMARRLVRDIHPEQADRNLAYRGDDRWMQSHDPVQAESLAGESPRLREGGSYLVTGGLGGLGLLIAEHLARRVQAKLVLTGRGGLPDRDEWEAWIANHGSTDPTAAKLRKLLEIEELGAQIEIRSADSADPTAMRDVVDSAVERFGAIHGVFHVAGAIDDGPIQAKTQASIDGVFSSKVHGTLVLEQVLAPHKPELMVLFSSSSSVLTPAGQIDYAAASSFLNAFAQSRSSQEGPYTLTVDWGVWRDAGNAVDAYERLGSGSDSGRPAIHPLLDRRIIDTSERIVFSTLFEGAEHWILDDHRTTDGQALIPGTGYLELARAAVNEAENSEQLELRNVFFVAPLMVGDQERVEARVSLSREKKGFSFEVESRLEGGSDWQLHAQGDAIPREAAATHSVDLGEVASRCDEVQEAPAGETLRALHEGQLRFGPRWEVLRSMRFGTGEALAHLELAEDFVQDLGSYRLHPALFDLATGFATPLIEGYHGEMLWAPMSYKRVVLHKPLPQRIVSHVRSNKPNHVDEEIAVFDVTILDESGQVLVEVEEFAIRKLAQDAAFAPSRGGNAGSGAAAGAAEGTRLSAAERLFRRSYELGITPTDGMNALDKLLSGGSLPQVFVSSIDLDELVVRFRAAGGEEEASHSQFERPELDSEYAEARDEVEEGLAELWREVLGVDKVGIRDDFFELGGHSLIAVRLFAKIRKTWDLEYAISVLFQAPTIEACAELIRDDLGIELGQSKADSGPQRAKHKFLVPLQKGNDPKRPPFFLVAGMFGNVLNLRHLAMHLGEQQTVYAIQAKGLMGDDEPHRRFEDMACDYLEEMRSVQPEGPYYVGGFSGGGITAMEIAQQLHSAGEMVGTLMLLDSQPAEEMRLSAKQKLSIHWQKLQRRGPAYLVSWLRNQIKWRIEQLRKKREPVMRETSPAEFRSKQIEIAFREALLHYETPTYPGRAVLFRPSHEDHYPIGKGYLFVDSNRTIVDHENRFGPHVAGGIEVHVVSGDHDAMVLEPHVRAMGATLRGCLEEAMAGHESETSTDDPR